MLKNYQRKHEETVDLDSKPASVCPNCKRAIYIKARYFPYCSTLCEFEDNGYDICEKQSLLRRG